MMAKPMKTLELHYPMIQFLIILNIQRLDAGDHATNNLTAWLVIARSLDQEMLIADATLSVIKPN